MSDCKAENNICHIMSGRTIQKWIVNVFACLVLLSYRPLFYLIKGLYCHQKSIVEISGQYFKEYLLSRTLNEIRSTKERTSNALRARSIELTNFGTDHFVSTIFDQVLSLSNSISRKFWLHCKSEALKRDIP